MSLKNLIINSLFLVVLLAAFSSCKKDDDTNEMDSKSRTYSVNMGQIAPVYAYMGNHATNFSAELMLEEMENDETKITVKLINPVAGQTYAIHAHDKVDPSSNALGLPYEQAPNGDVLSLMITTAEGEKSFTSTMSFDKLTTEYEGYFVVHDPMVQVNTADPTTYLVFGNFINDDERVLQMKTFSYDFNTGQAASAFAYNGSHPTTFKAELMLEEMADEKTKITVKLINPVAGESYAVHAHDVADPNTTPNGTPYNESPNGDVYAQMITATELEKSFTSDKTYKELTMEYEAFFVIHDPLQPVNTADPTTYIILGDFAR